MELEKKEAAEDERERRRKAAVQAISDSIRRASGEGRFLLLPELLSELDRLGPSGREEAGDADAEPRSLLEDALERNGDLREAAGKDGLPRYYSSMAMTEAYAGILLMKEENPLDLIAEITRENSRVYPRPIRLDDFIQPPFELTREQIEDCLRRMRDNDVYRDIARTQTSVGTDFLYSTLHLEADYASMLAEWYDVGQSGNP